MWFLVNYGVGAIEPRFSYDSELVEQFLLILLSFRQSSLSDTETSVLDDPKAMKTVISNVDDTRTIAFIFVT